MRRAIAYAAVAVIAVGMLNLQAEEKGEVDWLTDFEAAKQTAKEKERPILIDFTGSDWCGWCIKLKKEVFSKKPFAEFASENLVLFEADFPRSKQQSEELKKQNRELAETYQVQGFPTILLVDSEGSVIARTGYRFGGAESYVEHLKELLNESNEEG